MDQVQALVIDDNAQNLRVMTQLLAKNQVQAINVQNPLHLHDLLPSLQAPNVIFVDLEMPGLDGYETQKLLRQHFTSTPIIAYTVHVSEIDVVRESGFDGFLAKPLDSHRFGDMLARILRGEPVWERA